MSSTYTASPFVGKTFGVTVANVTKKFGKATVLKDVSLEVLNDDDSILVLVDIDAVPEHYLEL